MRQAEGAARKKFSCRSAGLSLFSTGGCVYFTLLFIEGSLTANANQTLF